MEGYLVLAAFTLGKFLVYGAFFYAVAQFLREQSKARLALKGAVHRLWLGLAATVLAIGVPVIGFAIVGLRVGDEADQEIAAVILTTMVWLFRAGVWWLATKWTYSALKGQTAKIVAIVVLGIGVNLLVDVVLWGNAIVGRGHFAPTLGNWKIQL